MEQHPPRPIEAFICPECGGALAHSQLGSLDVFDCHIGHRMTLDVLVEGHRKAVEDSAGTLLRSLEEYSALLALGDQSDAPSNRVERVMERQASEARVDEVRRLFFPEDISAT